MTRRHVQKRNLADRFPPSPPCGCAVCLGFCARPGWWTVAEAAAALQAGYADRMMLEISPERAFGVLAPAFRGCEGSFALQAFAGRGCVFLKAGRCELHGTGFQPLECRFCHHDRPGQGPRCHAAIEQEWRCPAGRALVADWCKRRGLWSLLDRCGLGKLKEGLA